VQLGSAVEVCGGVAQGTGAGNRPNWPQLQDISSSVSLPYVRRHRDRGTREGSRGTVCSRVKEITGYKRPWCLRSNVPLASLN